MTERSIPFRVAILILGSLALAVPDLRAAPPGDAWARAAGLPCTNLSTVAQLVFGDEEVSPLASWDEVELSDGSSMLEVVSDHGGGSCPGVAAFHFERDDGACHLVHRGGRIEARSGWPALNGRPVFDEVQCSHLDEGVEIESRTWFWDGGEYRTAWTELHRFDDSATLVGSQRKTEIPGGLDGLLRAGGVEGRLFGIFALDRDRAWVGGQLTVTSAQGAGPLLYGTTDGGRSWRALDLGIADDEAMVVSVFFLDPLLGWVTGVSGRAAPCDVFVARTVDGGATWIAETVALEPCFVPGTIEFLTPELGTLRTSHTLVETEEWVWKSADGGESWVFSHGRRAPSEGPANRLSRAADGSVWALGSHAEGDDPARVVRDDGESGVPHWRPVPTRPLGDARARGTDRD